jgi:hypothetical protein
LRARLDIVVMEEMSKQQRQGSEMSFVRLWSLESQASSSTKVESLWTEHQPTNAQHRALRTAFCLALLIGQLVHVTHSDWPVNPLRVWKAAKKVAKVFMGDAIVGILASCNTSTSLNSYLLPGSPPEVVRSNAAMGSPALQRHLMNATRSLIVIRRPAHVAVVRAIRDIKHLSSHLRAQKSRLVVADFFPLGEVLRELDEFDTCGCLPVTRVRVATLVAESRLGGVEVWVLGSCGGYQERVDA